jgi:hypothetical protein
MKVYCTGDERYPYFWLTDNPKDFYEPYEIELTEEEWKKFQAVDAENERWQDHIEDAVNRVRKKRLLESTKGGIKPKGFG